MKLFDIFMNDTVNKTETFVLDNWLLVFFHYCYSKTSLILKWGKFKIGLVVNERKLKMFEMLWPTHRLTKTLCCIIFRIFWHEKLKIIEFFLALHIILTNHKLLSPFSMKELCSLYSNVDVQLDPLTDPLRLQGLF